MGTESADRFLPEIFEREAKGYLADALSIPAFAMQTFDLDESQTKASIAYVSAIFREVYSYGGLRIIAMAQDGTLYGYSLVFIHPNAPEMPVYLHKIFVLEQYRGHGIGRQMMDSIITSFSGIALFCQEEKVDFYEQFGFVCMEYERPQDDRFSLSQYLYSDLVLMTNKEDSSRAPFFLLNDDDLYGALGLKH